MPGDADIAATGALLGDRARARILAALSDGRALPASVLAGEAGVAASTASEHLAKLVGGGLLAVERHGRHRYFRLAGADVARMLEALARVSPSAPVASLREGTRANALRVARTCYDHLAGMVGTGLMAAMIDRGMIEGGDGVYDPDRARRDRLSARGHDVEYRLTEAGADELDALGVDLRPSRWGRRRFVGYCVDWSEQRHHLAGAVGAAVHDRLLELGWVERSAQGRAVWLTPAGAEGLEAAFGLEPDPAWVHRPARARPRAVA
jgi:DNA-binding transcriptional ArsR family regulator